MCCITWVVGLQTRTAVFNSFERAEAWLALLDAKMASHGPILPC